MNVKVVIGNVTAIEFAGKVRLRVGRRAVQRHGNAGGNPEIKWRLKAEDLLR